MFESIKSAKIKEEEECEECGNKGVLINAIIDGRMKRVCNRCINSTNAIIIKKPQNVKIEEVPRRSVHEILEQMSGIKPKPIKKPVAEIKLEDLRQRYEEMKEKRKKLQEEKEHKEKEEQIKLKKELEENEKSKIFDRDRFKKYVQMQKEIRKRPIENTIKEIKPKETEPIEIEEKEINFNIEATKNTKVSDLFRRIIKRKRPELKPSQSELQQPQSEQAKQSTQSEQNEQLKKQEIQEKPEITPEEPKTEENPVEEQKPEEKPEEKI